MSRVIMVALLIVVGCSSNSSQSKLFPGEPEGWEGREKGIWFCLYFQENNQTECQPKLDLCLGMKALHEKLGHKPNPCERVETKVYCIQAIDDKDMALFFCTPNKRGCERYRIDYSNAGLEVTECALISRLPPGWDSATFSAATGSTDGNDRQQTANPTPLESHGSAVMSGTSP